MLEPVKKSRIIFDKKKWRGEKTSPPLDWD
jgi:hypothetical protein